IDNMTRLPAAIFIVDISHEHIAVAEAHRLGLKTFGIVDTNSDPNEVDYAIPANDDASKSVAIITNYLTEAIRQGLEERQTQRTEKEMAE
ncbi:MAG TPA: 30S ribosomal protein S2, partial [Saprospiraceae bacterium]|nr:30S ribosomal protein S2 [Saprospiraceae bacterium]